MVWNTHSSFLGKVVASAFLVSILAQAASLQPASDGKKALSRYAPTQGIDSAISGLRALPLSFEANQGQTDPQVRFLARGSGYTVFITPTGAVVGGAASAQQMRMDFAGSNPSPVVRGRDALTGRIHYFRGSDPKGWRRSIPTYARIQVDQVYPGIDLLYYGSTSHLEFDFVVAPAGDPNVIRMAFDGAEQLRMDSQGDLVIASGSDEVRLAKPLIYQEVDGVRRAIPGGYVIHSANQVGLEVAGYDRGAPLVVDPVLLYSTYFGGSGEDRGAGIAVDREGYAYLVGSTDSPDLAGRQASDTQDVFVMKLDPNGSLVYTVFFGGSGPEHASGIAVDAAGSAYVVGTTYSRDFPIGNAAQPSWAGDDDGFVVKLDPAGTEIVYSTYLGGSDEDGGLGIAVDAGGHAYVTGYTYSRDLPLVNAVQPDFGGGSTDAFVAKLASSGSSIVYATYLGGSGDDRGRSVAVDAAGGTYVVGITASDDFPTAAAGDAAAREVAGPSDAFLVKLQPDGSAFAYSTLLGGEGDEEAFSVAVDSSGNAYVAGETASADFPVVEAAQPTLGGGVDVFVTKVNGTGDALLLSTYLGGSRNESRPGLAVDDSGRVYVTGTTGSSDFPTRSPLQPQFGGFRDMFLVRIQSSGGALDYSTYLGGSAIDEARGCAVDSAGNAYVIGRTKSAGFPTVNALQAEPGGRGDAVSVKLKP